MMHLLLVAAGGAAGSLCRHLINLLSLRIAGPAFPWGTMFVNIAGSLAMGLLVGWLARRAGAAATELRLLAATGFLGGFTTFSAFSLDAVGLWERGQTAGAAIYVTASVACSLAALFAGLSIMRSLA